MMMNTDSIHRLVAEAEGFVEPPEDLAAWSSGVAATRTMVPRSEQQKLAEQSWFLRSAKEYSKEKATGERVRAVLWWVSSLSLLLNCVLAVALATISLSVKVVPYIVQVDKHGYSVPIKAADSTSLEDPIVQNVIQRDLTRWVEAWRTKVSDPKAQKGFVMTQFAMTPKDTIAHDKMVDWYAQHPPYEPGRTVDVDVQFVGPSNGASDLVWRAEWEESERRGSSVAKTTHFRATLTLAFSPVSTFKDVRVNAVGVYVTDFFFQQDAR
jgi:type IV secretion system protein TrbF